MLVPVPPEGAFSSHDFTNPGAAKRCSSLDWSEGGSSTFSTLVTRQDGVWRTILVHFSLSSGVIFVRLGPISFALCQLFLHVENHFTTRSSMTNAKYKMPSRALSVLHAHDKPGEWWYPLAV